MRHNKLSYRTMFPLCSASTITDASIGWSRKAGFTRRAAQRFYMGAARSSGEPQAAPEGSGWSRNRGNDHGA